MKTYLALGDSMSIDDYTGVAGGGAVNQLFGKLGQQWHLDDRTRDGCRMREVPLDGRGELITLTIGGNDLLWNREKYLREGVEEFQREHARLLKQIRLANPAAVFIVGDVYEPDLPLSDAERGGLAAVNAVIRENCKGVHAWLAPIHATFQGRSPSYLCQGIEPTLSGASAIARLFEGLYRRHLESRVDD